MISNIILILFLISLIICIVLNIDVLFAITFGMFLFFIYSIIMGNSFKKTVMLMIKGISKSKNVLIIFILIGILTASWRMSGTIAYIIYNIVPIVNPSIFILSTFLLCCLMSMLIGTSLGAAASMGVICMVISKSMGMNETFIGGAVLSGIYLGDRTSPMSSSATLVVALTNTNLYTNVKNMIKSAVVPFIITCILYFLLGLSNNSTSMDMSILSIFSDNYNLSFVLIIPALIVVIMSLFKIDVKIVMLLSSLIAMILAFSYQNIGIYDILNVSVFGYSSSNEQLAILMNGGGLVSMIRASLMITISSTYFGIFEETPILLPIQDLVIKIKDKFTLFGAMIFTGMVTSAIACNQSLAVMLTYQITKDMKTDDYNHALDLENTAILLPTLMPWNIAAAIPMATVGFSSASCLFAFFAYIVPIYIFMKRLKFSKSS